MKLPRRNPALPTSGPGRSERLLPEPPHRPAGWARGTRGSKIYHSRQKVCIIRQVGPAGRAGSRSTTEDERYGPPTGTGPERFTKSKCPRLISPLNEHLSLMNDFESSMLYICFLLSIQGRPSFDPFPSETERKITSDRTWLSKNNSYAHACQTERQTTSDRTRLCFPKTIHTPMFA